jgi:hypothetical protein
LKAEKTVTDFSKSRDGKEFLRQYFDFEKFPAPSAGLPVSMAEVADTALTGRAFEFLL